MGDIQDFEDFVESLEEISKMGFVETHRNADTGVGKTLYGWCRTEVC